MPTKTLPFFRNPERFYRPIPILVMTSQHDIQASSPTTVDLEYYAVLVFSQQPL